MIRFVFVILVHEVIGTGVGSGIARHFTQSSVEVWEKQMKKRGININLRNILSNSSATETNASFVEAFSNALGEQKEQQIPTNTSANYLYADDNIAAAEAASGAFKDGNTPVGCITLETGNSFLTQADYERQMVTMQQQNQNLTMEFLDTALYSNNRNASASAMMQAAIQQHALFMQYSWIQSTIQSNSVLLTFNMAGIEDYYSLSSNVSLILQERMFYVDYPCPPSPAECTNVWVPPGLENSTTNTTTFATPSPSPYDNGATHTSVLFLCLLLTICGF